MPRVWAKLDIQYIMEYTCQFFFFCAHSTIECFKMHNKINGLFRSVLVIFRPLYFSLWTQVTSIVLFQSCFHLSLIIKTHFRDIPQRLDLALDMMRWMQSIHQMQICLPHHSAHTCSSCVCSAGLIRGKMAGGGANWLHGGSLDAISLFLRVL